MIEVGRWQFLLRIVDPLTWLETALPTVHSFHLLQSYSSSFLLLAGTIVQNRCYDFRVPAHEFLLCLYSILHPHASFRVGIRTFNVDRTQITQVIYIICQSIFQWVTLRIRQQLFLSNGGTCGYLSEMLFSRWVKILNPLWYFRMKSWLLAIF